MKYFKLFFLSLAMTAFIAACGGGGSDHSHDGHDHNGHDHDGTTEMVHGEGPEYTSAYVCPMHCEGSGSDTAGKCPVCEMDYVQLDAHMKDGHKH